MIRERKAKGRKTTTLEVKSREIKRSKAKAKTKGFQYAKSRAQKEDQSHWMGRRRIKMEKKRRRW